MKKKILIIVYYWPPSGGAGVQRWLKFVKYLPQFDWEPTVVTTKKGDYPVIDESLLLEVPEKVRVVQTKTPSFLKLFNKTSDDSLPYGSLEYGENDSFIKKIAIWFRRNIIVPDARKLWNKYAYRSAKKLIELNDYQAVVTSGPPHSTHLVGLKLKKKYKINWIVDFRDPWTNIDYLKNIKRLKLTDKYDLKLERKVKNNCDKLMAVNDQIIAELNVEEKSVVITNGYDEDDFKNLKREDSSTLNINYFGNITIERNPLILLKAINMLLKEKKCEISLNFWGMITKEIKDKLAEHDVYEIVRIHSYLPHSEILQKMLHSSILLLIINNVPGNVGITTGKIFEYLGAKRPILGIGPTDGEAAKLIKNASSGKMFEYDNMLGIKNFINNILNNNEGFDFSEVEQFSRKALTKELIDNLK